MKCGACGRMAFADTLKRYSSWDDSTGTDKVTWHAYEALYDDIFARLPPDCAILEIGVKSGAFLQAAAEHLPGATVCGVDISPMLNPQWAWDRIRVLTADGTLPETAQALGTRFDLIVDDASHRPDDMVASLGAFAPFLKPGGVYVVEDIEPRHVEALKPQFTAIAAAHGLAAEVRDLRHLKSRFDDVVAVFTKPGGETS